MARMTEGELLDAIRQAIEDNKQKELPGITTMEFAEALGISESWASNLIRQGRRKGLVVGERARVWDPGLKRWNMTYVYRPVKGEPDEETNPD